MKEDKIVPQLRFPEFTDAWKQRKLREVIKEFYNGQTPYRQNKDYWGGNINWLTSGDLNRGVVTNTIEKITEECQKASRLRIVPKGTLVIAIMGLEAAGTRGNCCILGIETTINQACMALIANDSIATQAFLFQWYKSFGNSLALKYTQGTKQQNYNEELLGNLDISYPSLKEQQKIGAFFTKLDNTITLQQRKLNSLQKLKKGLLQKMFPKNGENIPEIRFPEFSDAWKQRELNEIADTIDTGKSKFSKSNIGKFKILGSTGVIGFDEDYDYEGSFLLTARVGANAGNLYRSSGKVKITDNTVFIKSKFIDYLFYSLGKFNLKRLSFGTGQPLIKSSELKKLNISVPCDEKEITKIEHFFITIDRTITIQQHKLNSLQKLKKGLLQQMFI